MIDAGFYSFGMVIIVGYLGVIVTIVAGFAYKCLVFYNKNKIT